MKELAIQFRFMYLFSHLSHHYVKFPTFFSDHSYFGELYETYEDIYDSLIEKMIGLDIECNEFEINSAAVEKLNEYKSTEFNKNADYFQIILGAEKEMCQIAENYDSEATYGVKNLLQGICDNSENRQYKLKQRLA